MTLCLIFVLNHPKVLIHQLAYKPWAHQEHGLFYFICFLPQSTKHSSSSRNQATRKQGTTLPCSLPSIAVTEMSQCLLITSLQGHRGGPTTVKMAVWETVWCDHPTPPNRCVSLGYGVGTAMWGIYRTTQMCWEGVGAGRQGSQQATLTLRYATRMLSRPMPTRVNGFFTFYPPFRHTCNIPCHLNIEITLIKEDNVSLAPPLFPRVRKNALLFPGLF